MRTDVRAFGVVAAVLAVLYVYPFLAPLPERATEPIVPPFPAEYGAAAIRDLEAAETLYREGDLAAAHALWAPLAEAGNPEAQFRIGRLYDRGELFERDWASADRWYAKAEAQGHPLAIHNRLIEAGIAQRTACNPQLLERLKIAADLGSSISQYNYAVKKYKKRCRGLSNSGYYNYFYESARQNFQPAHDAMVQILTDSDRDFYDPRRAAFHMYASAEERNWLFPFVFYLVVLETTDDERHDAQLEYLSWSPQREMRLP